jgi:hypothetical protein
MEPTICLGDCSTGPPFPEQREKIADWPCKPLLLDGECETALSLERIEDS